MAPLQLVARTAEPVCAPRTSAADRLRSALLAGDPQMHFQPVLDLCTGRLAGWENEHEQVLDMVELLASLSVLRDRGATVAVDDVGEGYAGLEQVTALAPDVLKLDRALVSGVHTDAAKAALVRAIVGYASSTGAQVCAEGCRGARELELLADLDVSFAQGWLVGRPAPDLVDVDVDVDVAASSVAGPVLAAMLRD